MWGYRAMMLPWFGGLAGLGGHWGWWGCRAGGSGAGRACVLPQCDMPTSRFPSVGTGLEHPPALCSSPPWGPWRVPAPLLAMGLQSVGASVSVPPGTQLSQRPGRADVSGMRGQGWGRAGGLGPAAFSGPTVPLCPQRLFEWLDAAELRIAEEFLVGGDLDMVQQQLAELKVGCAAGWGPEPWGQVWVSVGGKRGAWGSSGMKVWHVGRCWCLHGTGGRWVAKSCPGWPNPAPRKGALSRQGSQLSTRRSSVPRCPCQAVPNCAMLCRAVPKHAVRARPSSAMVCHAVL